MDTESCSWSDGSKDSAGAGTTAAATAEPTPAPLTDAANDNAALLSSLCKHVVLHWYEHLKIEPFHVMLFQLVLEEAAFIIIMGIAAKFEGNFK